MHSTPLKKERINCIYLNPPRGMLLDIEVFGTVSNGYHEALSTAFDDFTTWRKSMKLSSSQRRFTPGMLLRPATYGFYLNAKGHNSRIVCAL